jgi:DNA-binding phage protein
MSDTLKTTAQQALETTVKPLAREGLALHKAALPRVQQQRDKLEKAIADEDTATAITILQRELRAAMVPLAKAWEKLGDALTALSKLTEDDEALAVIGPQAEHLSKALSGAVKSTRSALRRGQEADEAADRAKADAASSEERARTLWRALCATQGAVLRGAREAVDAFHAMEAAARKAGAARDAKGVRTIRSKAEAAYPTTHDRMHKSRMWCQALKFEETVVLDGMSKEFRAEVERGRAGFEKVDAEVDRAIAEIAHTLQRIEMDIPIAPPDARKAATVLRLPSAAVERLGRALARVGDERALANALEDVARDHGLAKTGREIVAALEKAKVL